VSARNLAAYCGAYFAKSAEVLSGVSVTFQVTARGVLNVHLAMTVQDEEGERRFTSGRAIAPSTLSGLADDVRWMAAENARDDTFHLAELVHAAKRRASRAASKSSPSDDIAGKP
jgi:hypothetical protein